jgi:hypothetical protein
MKCWGAEVSQVAKQAQAGGPWAKPYRMRHATRARFLHWRVQRLIPVYATAPLLQGLRVALLSRQAQ